MNINCPRDPLTCRCEYHSGDTRMVFAHPRTEAPAPVEQEAVERLQLRAEKTLRDLGYYPAANIKLNWLDARNAIVQALAALPTDPVNQGLVEALERISSGRSSVTECATIARAALKDALAPIPPAG